MPISGEMVTKAKIRLQLLPIRCRRIGNGQPRNPGRFRVELLGYGSYRSEGFAFRLLADAKKSFRQQPEEGVGAFRYYCSPEGLITEVDLPDKWGLLWEKDGVITVVKDAERQQQNAQGEITILASIMRREGVKPRLFDYRKQNNEYEAERRN